MTASRLASAVLIRPAILVVWVTATCAAALAQQPPPPQSALPPARIIVTGEGSVTVPPDYAEISGGVTTQAPSAKAAADANSKLMASVDAALQNAGIAANDIQTSHFSVEPVYAPAQPNSAPKLTGFSVANRVSVRIRQIARIGAILDALIAAGATDAGNVQFLHSDASKTLDQARQAAITDARRKAELYAQASGLTLGGVAWISELPPYGVPYGMATRALAAAVPISPGEDRLRVEITVGFNVAH
jgi:uncharacterized protein